MTSSRHDGPSQQSRNVIQTYEHAGDFKEAS
jgi:hypothetical protein